MPANLGSLFLPGSLTGSGSSGINFPSVALPTRTGGQGRTSNREFDEEHKAAANSIISYYYRIDEMSRYLENHFTKTTTNIISDSVLQCIRDDSNNLVNIESDLGEFKEEEEALNDIIQKLQLITEIRRNMSNFIYYGSLAYLVKKGTLISLSYPYCPVIVRGGKGEGRVAILLKSDTRVETFKPEEVVCFSTEDKDLDMINSEGLVLNDEQGYLHSSFNQVKKEVEVSHKYFGGTPLLNGLLTKMKEYDLKDRLLAIIGIQDLVRPMLVLTTLSKETRPDEAAKFCNALEEIINKNADISYILSEQMGTNQLARLLFDNVRVLPDLEGKIQSNADLILNKLDQRLEKLREDQKFIQEDLYKSLGIPISYIDGQITRWDALKNYQRYYQRVDYYVESISSSFKDYILSVLKTISKNKEVKRLTKNNISLNFVDKSVINNYNKAEEIDTVRNMLDGASSMIDLAESLEGKEGIINPEGVMDYIKTKLGSIDPAFLKLFK